MFAITCAPRTYGITTRDGCRIKNGEWCYCAYWYSGGIFIQYGHYVEGTFAYSDTGWIELAEDQTAKPLVNEGYLLKYPCSLQSFCEEVEKRARR